jgi:hypothetical protein
MEDTPKILPFKGHLSAVVTPDKLALPDATKSAISALRRVIKLLEMAEDVRFGLVVLTPYKKGEPSVAPLENHGLNGMIYQTLHGLNRFEFAGLTTLTMDADPMEDDEEPMPDA